MIGKIKDCSLPLSLPITLENGEVIGTLKPITWADASDPVALERLTDWRNANTGSFLTQFVATPERTAAWLRNVVLPNDRQMAFWVLADDGVIGQIGFKELSATDVLSDNVIRGERGGHPRLFVAAHHAMFKWLIETFKLDSIYGYVLSDNIPAIMMNRQVGFSLWQRHALTQISGGDGDAWVVGEPIEADPGERFCWKVSLTKQEVNELVGCSSGRSE